MPTPIVIAHRGASGYLPEHTLPAKALAAGMGADYLEQDVVLTRDGVPIVLHDIHLDTVTDVAERFPGRARPDGRYYAIDFTLEEIRTLLVRERFSHKTGQPVFSKRFPHVASRFTLHTLAEEIAFVQGLTRSLGRTFGIYPEIKQPAFHRREGQDISAIVLRVLEESGYRSKEDACYVQCFDEPETERCRRELKCPLRVIQLLEEKDWKPLLAAPRRADLDAALAKVAGYADGIGPPVSLLVSEFRSDGTFAATELAAAAHHHGLAIHPWTLRRDELPKSVPSFDRLMEILFGEVRVDGAFSDFSDLTRQWIDRRMA